MTKYKDWCDVLPARIKKARLDKGLNQQQLALIIGVSDKSISAYETGRIIPPVGILIRLAQECGCSVEYFLKK